MHTATTALRKSQKITDGLRLREDTEAFRLLGKRDILELVSRDDQEDTRVRAAFMQLAGRMQIARTDLEAGGNAVGTCDCVANFFERFATILAREGEERVERKVVAQPDTREQRGERIVQTGTLREMLGKAHLDRTDRNVADAVFAEIAFGLPVLQDLEHFFLRNRHVGLIERAHLHQKAQHGDGVLPHHEVLGELLNRIDAEIQTRDMAVDVGEAHLEILLLIPQVVLRLVDDDAAIAWIVRKQKRVDFDVRKDTLAFFADALGDKLLDPQTQNAPALRRQEAELIAPVDVVAIEERRQGDSGIVNRILAA